MKQFTGKHSQLSSFIPQKNLYRTRKTVSFHLASNHSNYFESNVLSHFLYFRFTSRPLTSLIMPVGITGKYGPKYWPITARLIYLQALAISIILFTALYKSALTFYSVNKILSVTIQIRVLKNAFLWLVLAMLYKVALTFESLDKIPRFLQSRWF